MSGVVDPAVAAEIKKATKQIEEGDYELIEDDEIEYEVLPYDIPEEKNNPMLKEKIEPFDFKNPPIDPARLVSNLFETADEFNGIGLAANQCQLPYRVFVINHGEYKQAFFNPKIVHEYDDQHLGLIEEGCLSFPGLFVKVKRPDRVRVRFQDETGTTHTKIFGGLTARIIQHETDHLNGITFQERVGNVSWKMAKEKARKYNKKMAKLRGK